MARLRRLLPLLAARKALTWEASLSRELDFAEFFAGDQAVTRGLRFRGFAGAPVDARPWSRSSRSNVVVSPCSSWVWVSQFSTGRRPGNILGDLSNLKVRLNNKLASRVAHLIWLSLKRGSPNSQATL